MLLVELIGSPYQATITLVQCCSSQASNTTASSYQNSSRSYEYCYCREYRNLKNERTPIATATRSHAQVEIVVDHPCYHMNKCIPIHVFLW